MAQTGSSPDGELRRCGVYHPYGKFRSWFKIELKLIEFNLKLPSDDNIMTSYTSDSDSDSEVLLPAAPTVLCFVISPDTLLQLHSKIKQKFGSDNSKQLLV